MNWRFVIGMAFVLSLTCLAQGQVTNAASTASDPVSTSPVVMPSGSNAAPDVAPIEPPVPAPPLTVLDAAPPDAGAAGAANPQDQLLDIRPPFFFIRNWSWLWLVVASVAAIGLLVLLWFWLRPTPQLPAQTAYDLTLARLEKARGMMSETDPMPYAVFVSETIRGYLGQRFQTPSTRRTTEEFLRQMQVDVHTPLAEHRDLLLGFLQSCDLVKFAKYHPRMDELEEVQRRAQTFVVATKPLPMVGNGRPA